MRRVEAATLESHLGNFTNGVYSADHFYEQLWKWLRESNPLLCQLMESAIRQFEAEGKKENYISVTQLLQILFLLEPLPRVGERALGIVNQVGFGDLIDEWERFKKENPALWVYSLQICVGVDDDSKVRITFLMLRCLRLIRLQEAITETRGELPN